MDDYDLVGNIIDFENGELDEMGTLKLFSHLIRSGMVWQLQGFYGRTAKDLIEGNIISRTGEILIPL